MASRCTNTRFMCAIAPASKTPMCTNSASEKTCPTKARSASFASPISNSATSLISMAKRKRKCRRQATSWRFFSDAWRIEHLQKRQSPRKFWHFRGDCNAFCGIFFVVDTAISHPQAHLRKGECNKLRFAINPQCRVFCHSERQRGIQLWMLRFAQHDRVRLCGASFSRTGRKGYSMHISCGHSEHSCFCHSERQRGIQLWMLHCACAPFSMTIADAPFSRTGRKGQGEHRAWSIHNVCG